MFLQYGNYAHAVGECQIAITREAMVSGLGKMYGIREHWDVQGLLQADSTDAVNAAIAALVDAYSVNGYNISLQGSYHNIISANTLNGTRVVSPPFFPKGNGAELSTFRTYRLALEAEWAYENDGLLLEWSETVSFKGTGAQVWKFQEYLNGPPQQQILQQASVIHATQHGSATGNLVFPDPGYPIWPSAEHQDQREITQEQPSDRWGRKVVHWSYHFSSISSF